MISSMKEAANAAPPAEETSAPVTTETTTPAPAVVTEVASTPAPEGTVAVIPPTDRTVAVPGPVYYEDNEAEGEFDDSDSIRATMVIVAKTGKMSSLFTPGDIVVNKDVVIGGVKAPIDFIATLIKKRYQNDLHADTKKMGDIVDTGEQVLQRGGIIEYRPGDDKTSTQYWKPILQTGLMVKRPAECTPAAAALFMVEIDGEFYCPVNFTARAKTAYNGIGKILIDTKKKKKTVRTTVFRLTTKHEEWAEKNKSWIQPNITPVGETPQTVVTFLKEYVG